MIQEFRPHTGLSAVSTEPTLDPLSPSLSVPPPLCLFLKMNKHKKKSKAVTSKLCDRLSSLFFVSSSRVSFKYISIRAVN